jgi:hypothetical protein
MNERTPSSIERFPTEREVMQLLERLTEGASFVEIERGEDDLGLYRLVLKFIDSEGNPALCDFTRKGTHLGAFSGTTVIDKIFLDDQGIPVSGDKVATYENGNWKIEV